jgi:hypothetical protein
MGVGRKCVGWLWVVLLVGAAACGSEEDGGGSLEPDPSVAPFVGDWQAKALTLTSVFVADLVVDLLEQGATFTLNVQPSGQYTAVLIFAAQASTEIGQVEVSGTTLTLRREFPTPGSTPGVFEFFGANRFVLDGDSEFDFNLDGTLEPAMAHFEFERR